MSQQLPDPSNPAPTTGRAWEVLTYVLGRRIPRRLGDIAAYTRAMRAVASTTRRK